MADYNDNPTGAILHIDDSALKKIQEAENKINDLAKTSAEKSKEIAEHFSGTMVGGVDAFLQKLQQAKNELGSLGFSGATTLAEGFAKVEASAKATSATVSQLVQTVSGLSNTNRDWAVSLMGGDASQVDALSKSIAVLEKEIKQLEKSRSSQGQYGYRDSFTQAQEQEITNQIQLRKELIANLKKSEAEREELDAKAQKKAEDRLQKEQERATRQLAIQSEKGRKLNEQYHAEEAAEATLMAARRKAFDDYERMLSQQQNKSDKSYLTEENRLLNERIRLQSQLNKIEIERQRNNMVGSGSLSDTQIAREQALKQAYDQVNAALVEMDRTRRSSLSAEAQQTSARREWIDREIDQRRVQVQYEKELASERLKAQKIIEGRSQNTLSETAREELEIQRKLTSLYAEKLRYEKELKGVQVETKVQGNATEAQKSYIQYLLQQIANLKTQINDVAEGYGRIKLGVQQAYQSEKADFMAKKNFQLAESLDNIARKQADMAAKNPWNQLMQDTSSADSRIAALDTEIAQLNRQWQAVRVNILSTKQAIDALGDPNTLNTLGDQIKALNEQYAKLAAQKTARGTSVQTYDMQQIQQQIQALTALQSKYAQLTAEQNNNVNKGTALENRIQQLEQQRNSINSAAQAQRDYNDQVEKFAATGKSVSDVVAEYKQLTAELEKLRTLKADADKYQMGTSASATDYNAMMQRTADVEARKKEIEQLNIQEINDFRAQKENEANRQSVSAFVQAEAEKKKEADKTNELAAKGKAESQRTYNGALAYADSADTYEKQRQAVENLKTAMSQLSQTDTDYKQKLATLEQKLRDTEKAMKDVKNAMSGKAESPTFASASANAKLANTKMQLQALQEAYKQLQEVMSKTKYNTKEWVALERLQRQTRGNLDKMRSGMGALNQEHQKLGGVVGQLTKRFAALFAVDSIKNYITKMVEVRAQFELQRIALGAILQDVDRANDVFKDVQAMALESPFSIMQLEKATKQIAAFGVQADKLKPSIKMLADISAGLGVDIDRLILVYGHIKANNALQQLHVRQFTNAGFNIAQNLADYYTEIEGKLVSVADVTERIHKKMVSFADVEAVLQRVTSAGGMFYDMQKKQSESLWGQMQRIKDQADLMFNSIGQSNQGVIAWALTAVRQLITHWRTLTRYVRVFGGVLAAIGVVKMIKGMIHYVQLARKALIVLTIAAQTANQALVMSGIGGAIALIVGLIAYLLSANEAAEELNEEMERIGNSQKSDMDEKIADYLTLAEKIRDTKTAYSEQQEALAELKREYNNILPAYMLEYEYITQNTDGYKDATQAIREYYAAQEYEKKVAAIQSSKYYTEAQKNMRNVMTNIFERGGFDESVSKAAAKNWADTFVKELSEGKLDNSAEAIAKRFSEVFGEHLDPEVLNFLLVEHSGEADFTDVIDQIEKLKDAEGDITLASLEAKNQTDAFAQSLSVMPMERLERDMREYQKRLDATAQAKELLLKQGRDRVDMGFLINGVGFSRGESIDDLNKKMQQLQRILEQVAIAMSERKAKDIKEQFDGQFDSLEKSINAYGSLAEKKHQLEITSSGTAEETASLKEMQEELNRAEKAIREQAKALGLDLKPELFSTASNTFSLAKNLRELKQISFKSWCERAVNALSPVTDKFTAIAGAIDKIKQGLNKFAVTLGLDKIFPGLAGDNTPAENKAEEAAKAAKKAADNNEAVIKRVAKSRSLDEASLARWNKKEGEANKTYAERLENEAKDRINRYEYYKANFANASEEARNQWLTAQGYTVKQLEFEAKEAKGLQDIAKVYKDEPEKSKSSKGKDTILELWKNRLKAVQDFYKKYDELRKGHYSEDSALATAREAYQSYFASRDVSLDMDEIISRGMDKNGARANVAAMLEQVRKIRPQLADEFAKAMGDYEVEIDVELNDKRLKDFKSSMDRAFDSYELTKTFKDMDVNVDLMYMLGGKPTTLEDIRKDVETWKSEMMALQRWGKNEQDAYDELVNKITETDKKELQERIKAYGKYAAYAYGEAAKVQIATYTQMQKMYADFDQYEAELNRKMQEHLDMGGSATDEQYQTWLNQLKMLRTSAGKIVKGMVDEMNQKLSSVAWDDFKNSDVFNQMYSDLENLSERSLDELIRQLRQVRTEMQAMGNVDVKDLKEIDERIQKITEAKINLGNWSSFAAIYKQTQSLRGQQDIQSSLLENNSTMATLNRRIRDYETILKLKRDGVQLDTISGELTAEQSELVSLTPDQLETTLAELKEKLKVTKEGITADEKDLETWRLLSLAVQKMQEQWDQLKEYADSLMESLNSGLEAFGKGMDDATKEMVKALMDAVMNCVSLDLQLKALAIQAKATGVAMNSALGVIGWVATAVSAIVSVLTAWSNWGDKQTQKEIDKTTDKIEDLQRAYEKVSETMQNAINYREFQKAANESESNIRMRIAETKELISLEGGMKNSDDDQIREWKQQIQDLEDELAELKEARIEALGGFGSEDNMASAAEEFMNVWLDAYKETGDGLEALQEQWDEYIDNLVIKQGVLRIVGKRMQKLFDLIDTAVSEGSAGGEYLTKEELDNITAQREKLTSQLNSELKSWLEALGYTSSSSGDVSDLQKGIENITESQAAAIEAYMNSIRFYVAEQYNILSELLTLVKNQYGAGDSDTMVVLKDIRTVLRDIDKQFKSIIGSTSSGCYVKIRG